MDFSKPLELIFEYLKESKGQVGALEIIGINFIYKLSQGTANLGQRVLSMKILNKILTFSTPSRYEVSNFFINIVNNI